MIAGPAGSVDELLDRSGHVALELSGAGQSAWNGQVIKTDGSILGLAHWDGTLYLDRECILDPLQRMYEHAGQKQPVQTLVLYRESLATLLHEHAHFLGPAGSSQEAAQAAFTRPGSRQLEEGVAEAWAQDHLDEYLTRLAIDKVAPGIKDVQAGGYYAAFVPAVRRLATDLEVRNDLEPGQVLDVLNRETAAGQFPLLVSLVYNSTRLPDLEPSGTDTRDRLESILRSGLAHLDTFDLYPPGDAAAKSHSTAAQILAHLHHETATAESACHPHPSACALPPPSPPTPTHATPQAHTHLAPPAPADPPARLTAQAHIHLSSPASVNAPARLAPHPLQTALAGVSPPAGRPAGTSTPADLSPPPLTSPRAGSPATAVPRRAGRSSISSRGWCSGASSG